MIQEPWGWVSTPWVPLYFVVLSYDPLPHGLQKEVSLVE